MSANNGSQPFWEHLDELRAVVIRVICAVVVTGIIAFCFKEQLFTVVLAPGDAKFITYRLLDNIASLTGAVTEDFAIQLINTGVARQFIVHMKTAMYAGVLCASPYIVYELFRFVSPALYENERRYAVRVAGGGYVMFFVGVVISYFIVFPLTFRFLGTYQVSGCVANMITLDSYMSTLVTLCLIMGIVCEMPVLAWLFAKLNLISAGFLRRYRKHAVVVILCLAAVITPTSDMFTVLVVAAPMCLLYEFSIFIVRHVSAA